MRARSDQVDDEPADERTVAEREALAKERDVQHRTTVGTDTDPTGAAVLNGGRICAVEELREFRALVRPEQLLDPGRMIKGIRADDIYARHNRISHGEAIKQTAALSTAEVSKNHAIATAPPVA